MTSQPPPDPYGQPQQPDPYGPGPTSGQPQQPDPYGPGPTSGQPQQPDPYGPSVPQYGQSPYQQPGYPPPPPGPPGYPPPTGTGGTNTLAILALVFAFVFWPAGIVCGHIAKKQIAERGEEGSGLATAGLVLSYVIGGLSVLCCGLVVVAVVADSA